MILASIFSKMRRLATREVKATIKHFFMSFSAARTCFKGHLHVCHSEICRGSSPNGHLSEKVTAPSRQFFKVSFSACLRPLADHKITAFCLSPEQGEADNAHHPAAYTTVPIYRVYIQPQTPAVLWSSVL